jgi:ABC-type phosphate transport system auxiliary subunit
MITIGIGIAIIILASAVCKYVEGHASDMPSEAEARLIARMSELERRLTDIQDVMIAIDEKLNRHPVL